MVFRRKRREASPAPEPAEPPEQPDGAASQGAQAQAMLRNEPEPQTPTGSPSMMDATVEVMAARVQRQRLARERRERLLSPSAIRDAPRARTAASERDELQACLAAALEPPPPPKPSRMARARRASTRSLKAARRCCCSCSPRGCFYGAVGCAQRCWQRLEDCLQRRQVAAERRRARAALLKLAVDTGQLPPGRSRPDQAALEALRFSPEQVVEALQRTRPRPKPSFLQRYLDGELSGRNACLRLLCLAIVAAVLLLVLQLLLVLAMYYSRDVGLDRDSGALLDPAPGGRRAVAASATVRLQPLWDYPALALDELRKVEDVVFFHNDGLNVQRSAVVERSVAGAVALRAVDGSVVRVEPDGRSFWRRPGFPEERLQAMEAWRTVARNAEVVWLTSGVLATQATLNPAELGAAIGRR